MTVVLKSVKIPVLKTTLDEERIRKSTEINRNTAIRTTEQTIMTTGNAISIDPDKCIEYKRCSVICIRDSISIIDKKSSLYRQ